ncbi:MAG: TonB family protein [Pyrinomonadaceae bacterium]
MNLRRVFSILLFACAFSLTVTAQTNARRTSVAVLDFGDKDFAHRAADKLSSALSSNSEIALIDREQSHAAARGIGYTGSLNMTLEEARDLGSAIGCDFFITGDAQTVRRSPSNAPVYYESYASIFIVSARTGRLVLWDRPQFETPAPQDAEKKLLDELSQRAARYAAKIRVAEESERNERALALSGNAPVIEDAPQDANAAQGFREPQPYRRLRPPYTEEAASAEVEATVDVLVDLDAQGEVLNVSVARWAGFGLDEATINTVRQMHFRPAMRDGIAIPLRVLLRYNFRKPPKDARKTQ